MKAAVGFLRTFFLLMLGWLAGAGLANAALFEATPVKAELVSERTGATPGSSLRLALRLTHAPRWHTYWRNPGDAGLATEIRIDSPAGWSAGPIEWPTPKRFAVGPLANFGYEGETLLPFRVQVPAGWTEATVSIRANVTYVVCKDVCIPGDASVSIELPVLAAPLSSVHAAKFAQLDAQAPRPDPTLQVRAHLDGRALALDVPQGQAPQRAEFFPFEPGLTSAPAGQRLHRTSQGWQLSIARPEYNVADPASVERVAGVLVLDGRAVEVDAAVVRAPAPPAQEPLAVTWPLGSPHAAADADAGASEQRIDPGELVRAVGFALLGGLLLNLMPCVLPVIGLKALGIASASAAGKGHRALLAGAYAAGVIATFLALAGVLVALRNAGTAVGWGFQLQSPSFLAAMALLFFLIGLNLLGVFEVRGPTLSGAGAARPSASGMFAGGVLGTLVATPCSAPFMGAAIGYTLGQSTAALLTVFLALGVGLALPVAAAALYPRLLGWVPKPGAWMVALRRALALPMFATVVWLVWLLVRQTDANAVLTTGAALLLLGVAAWLYGASRKLAAARTARHAAAAVLAIAAVAIGLPDASRLALSWMPSAPDEAVTWEPYSRARLEELRAAGRIVFVEFTADWCVVCQANDALVLDRAETKRLFAQQRVALLRADWTRQEASITTALSELGRNSVPAYAVYVGPDRPVRLLPELLTVRALRAVIEEAAAGRDARRNDRPT